MKGTAILYQKDLSVKVIENLDHTVFNEIQEQCGCEHCTCKVNNKVVDFGSVSPVFWHEEEIDWDYGY
jgi:hypothetical protein